MRDLGGAAIILAGIRFLIKTVFSLCALLRILIAKKGSHEKI